MCNISKNVVFYVRPVCIILFLFMTKSGYINMFVTCHMSLFVTDCYSNHTVL